MPREALPSVLEWVSDVLPLSYAVDAVAAVRDQAEVGADLWWTLSVLLGFAVVALVGAALTLPRRTE